MFISDAHFFELAKFMRPAQDLIASSNTPSVMSLARSLLA